MEQQIHISSLINLQYLNLLKNKQEVYSEIERNIIPQWFSEQDQIPDKLIGVYRHQPKDKASFNCIKWFNCGDRLATGLQQGELVVVSVQKDMNFKSLKIDDTVRAICLIQNDNGMIVGDKNGNVRIIDCKTMRDKSTKLQKLFTDPLREISASQTNQKFLTCTDKQIWIWDTETGQPELSLDGAGNSITSSEWNPIHSLLISSSKDLAQAVKLWDPRSGIEVQTINKHKGNVNKVRFNSSGNYFASVSKDQTTKVFDIRKSDNFLCNFKSNNCEVHSLAWKPNSETTLAVADEQGFIFTYDTQNQNKLTQMQKDNGQQIFDLQWSSNGVCLASLGNDKKIEFWAQDSQFQGLKIKQDLDNGVFDMYQRSLLYKQY